MKLPKLIRAFTGMGRNAGFTMIELLVVISVIGVLAVAVLSSINPIEQINKGRDTRTRSDAAQLINAVDRYFAVHEIYPWNDATYATALAGDTQYNIAFPDGTACADTGGYCSVTGNGNDTEWLDALTATAEVKGGYISRLRNANVPLQVQKAAGTNETMFTCFTPASQAFQDEAIQNCLAAQNGGGIGNDIPAEACQNGPYDNTSTWVDEQICLP